MIKAIETEYSGHLFRSRLEARWAVFFDAAGIEWKYEPEGFETLQGDKIIRYLPDFYLPQSNTWVEVKPTPEKLAEDGEKLGSILDWSSPLPGITDSYHSHGGEGLLCLFDIPNIRWGLVLHPIITHYKGLFVTYGYFTGGWNGFIKLSPRELEILGFFYDEKIDCECIDSLDFTYSEWLFRQHLIPTNKAYSKIINAYDAARKARFEHGCKGRPDIRCQA